MFKGDDIEGLIGTFRFGGEVFKHIAITEYCEDFYVTEREDGSLFYLENVDEQEWSYHTLLVDYDGVRVTAKPKEGCIESEVLLENGWRLKFTGRETERTKTVKDPHDLRGYWRRVFFHTHRRRFIKKPEE